MVQTIFIYSIYVCVCIYVRVYTHTDLRKGTTLQNVSSLAPGGVTMNRCLYCAVSVSNEYV